MKRFLTSTRHVLESFTTTNSNVTSFMSSVATNTRHLSQQSQQQKPLTPQHCDIESQINHINGHPTHSSISSITGLGGHGNSNGEEISTMVKDMIQKEVSNLRAELSSVNTELQQMKSKERRQELVIEMLSQKLHSSRESNTELQNELHRVENELHIIKSNGTAYLQGQFMMRTDGNSDNNIGEHVQICEEKAKLGKNNNVTTNSPAATNGVGSVGGVGKTGIKRGGLKTSMEVDLY